MPDHGQDESTNALAPSGAAADGPQPGSVIVAGFGVIGRAAADAARAQHQPVTVVETNPRTIQTQRNLGLRVVEGCITELETLKRAGIMTATMLVLAIPDDEAVLRSCCLARQLRPDLCIIVRSRYMSLALKCEMAGATCAVTEELAAAIEMARIVTGKLEREGTEHQASGNRHQ